MPAQMQDNEIILKYLMEQLRPEQRDELNQLRGKNSIVSAADPDDLAEDIRKGRIAMDRVPPRLMRSAFKRSASSASTAGFHERFPEAAHIRTER